MKDSIECIRSGDTTRLAALLQQDPSLLSQADERGDTLLHQAVQHDQLPAVKLLLDAGADPNVRAADGDTPLHCAAGRPIADVIDSGCVLDVQKAVEWSLNPENLNMDILRLLLARGADVSSRTEWGGTPLHGAATTEQAEVLIRHGADVNARDNDGRTPVHNIHDGEIVRLLLAHGADPNSESKDGVPPVISQVTSGTQGSYAAIEALLDGGADPKASDGFGGTALHFMGFSPVMSGSPAARGQIRIACALLFHGADVGAKTTSDSTRYVDRSLGYVDGQPIRPMVHLLAGSTPRDAAVLSENNFMVDLIDRYTAGGDAMLKRLLKESEEYPSEADLYRQIFGPGTKAAGKRHQGHESEETTEFGARGAGYRGIDAGRATQSNVEYQAELRRWQALPWWRRLLTGKPRRPAGT